MGRAAVFDTLTPRYSDSALLWLRGDFAPACLCGYFVPTFEATVDPAEFDRFADEYDQMLRQSIAVTGEGPEFFHEYKIKALQRMATERRIHPESVLDFGCGPGNSTAYLRRYFPQARLLDADVSQRSLDVAASRFPGVATGLRIEGRHLPLADAAVKLAFSACVFHHIPQQEHGHWLGELHRVTQPGGMLCVFEHNPLNPLTLRAVNSCPFDANARLLRARELVAKIRAAGWTRPRVRYHIFFPRALAAMRRWEPWLSWLPAGGQYSVTALRRD